MHTYEVNQEFRFVEGTGYIEAVVKSDFFPGKDLFNNIHAQLVLIYHHIKEKKKKMSYFIL